MKLRMALLLLLSCVAVAQDAKSPTTFKGVLLEQLKTTHNAKDWFVDGNTAIAGLTAEQASWTDGKGNHSVGQLTYHMVFWNRQVLAKMKGETPEKFSGNNDETFNKFDAKQWAATVKAFDDVMNQIEATVEGMDDAALQKASSTIAHIGAHNAYHIGQIVFVRKEQGSWDPEKGVK
jgi:uncharacterized damage-inducible protein DinB